MSKDFLNYEQQLDYLENEKELIIPNREYAREMLERYSYYSLIGGYKQPFKHKLSGKYLRGVTFNEVVSFYIFDEKLRSLFLQYILHIERHLKSMISYYFCEKHGASQSEYLNPQNFGNGINANADEISRLIKTMAKVISLPSSYSYIIHHVKKYHNVPLWVAVNAMTFGTISKFFQYMPNDLQTKVALNYPGFSEKLLHQMITAVAKCRNVCAHGERLYNLRMRAAIPDTVLHHKLKIPQKKGRYVCGRHDLFAVVIALRYLLPNAEFKSFKRDLQRLITQLLKDCPHISNEQILSEMGFPANWKRITSFKKV